MSRNGLVIACISTLGLTACGGGSGGGFSAIPDSGNPPEAGGAAVYSSGRISDVSGIETVGVLGQQGQATVVVDGNTNFLIKAISDEDVASDGSRFYRYVIGDDGQSYALIGYTLGGSFVGEFIEGASQPAAAQASYSGQYRGQLFGPFSGPVDIITGAVAIDADFAGDTFDGRIFNKSVQLPSSGYDLNQIEGDVLFSGNISGGVMTGSHSDANSSGVVNAIAFDSGVVGTVAINHPGASTFTGDDIPE